MCLMAASGVFFVYLLLVYHLVFDMDTFCFQMYDKQNCENDN